MTRLKKKNLEFIRASKRRNSKDSRRRLAIVIVCAVPAVMAAALALRSLWQWNQIRVMQKETREIVEYVEREDNQQAGKQAEDLLNEMSHLEISLMNMNYLREILDVTPELDGETVGFFAEAREVLIEEASMKNGTIELTAATENYWEAVSYIKKLEQSGRFEDVNYEGFEHTDLYRFHISCKLKAGWSPDIQQEGK